MRLEIEKKVMYLETENKVHIARTEIIYNGQREAWKRSTKFISMDFQKNLPCPNIIYYKQRFSYFSFNIQKLFDNKVIFYIYSETHGRKGANKVTSFLINQYITNILNPKI